MPSHQENPNTGYITALGSAVFLSLTSIFISYLNINFQLPALVLAFWREIIVASILLIIFALFKRGSTAWRQSASSLFSNLRFCAGALQCPLDGFRHAERGSGKHGAVAIARPLSPRCWAG